MTTFARNLQLLMDINFKTRMEVCKACGINYSTLTEWFNAGKIPRPSTLNKLAEYFKVPAAYFFEEEHASELDPNDVMSQGLVLEIKKLSPEGQSKAEEYIKMLLTMEDLKND